MTFHTNPKRSMANYGTEAMTSSSAINAAINPMTINDGCETCLVFILCVRVFSSVGGLRSSVGNHEKRRTQRTLLVKLGFVILLSISVMLMDAELHKSSCVREG